MKLTILVVLIAGSGGWDGWIPNVSYIVPALLKGSNSENGNSWSDLYGNVSLYTGITDFGGPGGKGSSGKLSPPTHRDCPKTKKQKHRGPRGPSSPDLNIAINDQLEYFKNVIPPSYNVFCLVKHFTNFDNLNEFLDLLESVMFTCRHRKPSKSECKMKATFQGNIKSKRFVPPVKWPCLQKALNTSDFYIHLNKIYAILNPCASHAPKLDLLNGNRSALWNDENFGYLIYGLWWFWWYFISGQVIFVLYPRNGKSLKSTVYEDGLIFGNQFNPSLPTKILVHGYFNYHGSIVNRMLRNAYSGKIPEKDRIYKKNKYNIVIADWSSMSFEPYPISRNRIIPVAKACVALIKRLVKDYGISIDSIHIIGHSLGAHVAGITGHLINDDKSVARTHGSRKTPKMARITGLDPAFPLFLMTPPKWQIGPDAARFVDIVHTSSYTFGIGKRAGHADFYANGGFPNQPGCGLGGLLGIDTKGLLDFGVVCAHYRAAMYYAESVNRPKAFLARNCSSFTEFTAGSCDWNPTAYMGEYASIKARGSYYFTTAAESPFGLGKKGI